MSTVTSNSRPCVTTGRGRCGCSASQNKPIDAVSVLQYRTHVISSFNDKRTTAIFLGKVPKGFPTGIGDVARRKLRMLDVAKSLSDLGNPPGDRLDALHGDRARRHSIRVNDQWRVCFRWHEGNAFDIELVDYH